MSSIQSPELPKPKSRLFVPILAGATLRDRMIACVVALIGIGLTSLVCAAIMGRGVHVPLIVAPIGASAVLLFAVPASPLAQPWPIIGGNTISALVGVVVANMIGDPALAVGVGVALAIAVMSLTRCLHPPGGAAALTAVLGGPAVTAWGFVFPFVPVALNSILLVAFGIAFHRLFRRAYPHSQAPAPVNTHQTRDLPAQLRVGFNDQDIDAAITALDETYDIDRADLGRLMRQVELQALMRSKAGLRCADIMSRDIVKADHDTSPAAARALLLDHNVRTLPVIGADGRLAGTVGLRELAHTDDRLDAALSAATVARAADPAIGLLPVLTDGRSHAVVIVDEDRHVLGLITQTDLLAAIARLQPG